MFKRLLAFGILVLGLWLLMPHSAVEAQNPPPPPKGGANDLYCLPVTENCYLYVHEA